MTEKRDSDHENQDFDAFKNKPGRNSENNSEVIELSDIAIGITPEDDAIVELTEEVIGGALNGFAGAVRELVHDDEQILDLSDDKTKNGFDEPVDDLKEPEPETADEPIELKTEDIEEDLSKELDDFFETEEEAETEEASSPTVLTETVTPEKIADTPISVSEAQIQSVAERVFEKMYSGKIDQLVNEVIEKKVASEIDRLKEQIINALKK